MKGCFEKPGTAYLAPIDYETQAETEIENIIARYGRLFITDQKPKPYFWVQNIWYEPFVAEFQSISEAAHILKSRGRNWALYSYAEHRRGALIQDKLPYFSNKPLRFPAPLPKAPLGSWMLLDRNTLLASPRCSSPFRHGEPIFEECKIGPPSRAYLKLWEAFTLLGKMPGPNDTCLEIGACPGGWTWVLATLGSQILAVDRSELDRAVGCMPGVNFIKGNAFNMTPQSVGRVDWIFSDVACYPEKLYEWVTSWIESGLCQNFVCTLKFQGEPTYAIAQQFAQFPHSKVLHLANNKHELTWIKAG